MTNSPFENEIRENIERDGRFIMGVGATEPGDQWFYYTVGNHCRGLPELLMIGPSNRGVGGVLDDLSEAMIKQGRAFSDGETVSLGGKFPVKVIAADFDKADRDYTVQAGAYFEEPYDVMQVVPPDREGRYPDDPLCTEPYRSVPILRRRREAAH